MALDLRKAAVVKPASTGKSDAPLKRLWEVLSPGERTRLDELMDSSGASSDEARDRARDGRLFLEKRSYFSAEAEVRWLRTAANQRLRILSELAWRTSCIMAKSDTAVVGLSNFTLGYGFSLSHTEMNGEDAFIVHEGKQS